MIILMMIAGLVPLVFGLILLLCPSFGLKPSEFLDRVVFVLDDLLHPYQLLVGLFLTAVGCWMLYLAVLCPGYCLLNLLWLVLIGFGLLYMFKPHWASKLAKVADKSLFSTDAMIAGSCRSFGLMLIIAGGYILYQAVMMR